MGGKGFRENCGERIYIKCRECILLCYQGDERNGTAAGRGSNIKIRVLFVLMRILVFQ